MQAQHPSGSGTEAITNSFAVGDKVSYVALKTEGRGYRLNARKGVIVAIDGSNATVRTGNGRPVTLPLDKLSPEAQPNALTRALLGSADNA